MKETHQGFLSRSITRRSGSFAEGKTCSNKKRQVETCRFLLNWFDNNDTVSNSFIWFHSKNETIKREVKLSFGAETMLICLSNWNLYVCYVVQ